MSYEVIGDNNLNVEGVSLWFATAVSAASWRSWPWDGPGPSRPMPSPPAVGAVSGTAVSPLFGTGNAEISDLPSTSTSTTVIPGPG